MRRALPVAALLVALLAAAHAHPPRLGQQLVADISAVDESIDLEELARKQVMGEAVEMIQDEEGVLDGGSNTSAPCNNSSDKSAAQSQAEKDAASTKAMAALGMKPNHTKTNNTAVQKNVTSFAEGSAKIQKAIAAKANKNVGKMEEDVLGKNLSATVANATGNTSNVTQQSSNASAVSGNGTVVPLSSNGTNGTVNLTLSKKTDKEFANATKAKEAQQAAALNAMGMKKEDIDPSPVECGNSSNSSNVSNASAPAPPKVDSATDTSDMPSGLLNSYAELTGKDGGKATGAEDDVELEELAQ